MTIRILLFSLFSFMAYHGVAQVPKQIIIAPGPEDLVLDTLSGNPRLIISCDERRDKKKMVEGGIWSYDLQTEKKYEMKRVGDSLITVFNPHGIFLFHDTSGIYLFVVNHTVKRSSEIIRYRVEEKELIYDDHLEFKSTINSVTAISKEKVYFTNDRAIFGKVCSGNMICKHIHKQKRGIWFPNGILAKDGRLYLTTTIFGKFRSYDIDSNEDLGKKQKHFNGKGLDNLRQSPDENTILTTSHTDFGAFSKNIKDPSIDSPSEVLSYDLETGETSVIYEESGATISCASVAVIYDGYMYLGQVFENYIVKVKI